MNNTKFIATAFVFLSLFIIVLFTKNQIFRIPELYTLISQVETEKDDLLKEHKKLEDTKNIKLKSGSKEYNSKIAKDIEKYSKGLKEDELLDFIYSEIGKLNGPSNPLVKRQKIEIGSLKISNSQLNLMNFYESNITLGLKVPSESKLRDVLSFLNDNDKYKFFITSLNYENNKENQESGDGITVSIPFKVFYSNYEGTK